MGFKQRSEIVADGMSWIGRGRRRPQKFDISSLLAELQGARHEQTPELSKQQAVTEPLVSQGSFSFSDRIVMRLSAVAGGYALRPAVEIDTMQEAVFETDCAVEQDCE